MAFQLQQRLLAPQTACVARELATGTEDTVARHEDAHRITPDGRTNRPDRQWFAQLPGQFAIRLALPSRDVQQGLPD